MSLRFCLDLDMYIYPLPPLPCILAQENALPLLWVSIDFCMVAEQLLDLVAVALVSLELLVPPLVAIGLLLTVSVGCVRCQRERNRKQCKVDRWARLVRKINRIRRLQRIFACVGLHLRENISKGIKEKLK